LGKVAAFRLLVFLSSRLPIGWLKVGGFLAGMLAFLFAHGARRAVLANLRVVLPDASENRRRRIALRTFVHGAWSYIELLGVARRMSLEDLDAAYPAPGWVHFERAKAEGKGIIIATAHLGQPSNASQLFLLRGIPASAIVERLEPPALHELIAGMRGHYGMRMLPLGPTALRGAVAALRRGELVGIVSDRDVAGTGEIFQFFGRPTRVTTAPAAIARRTGAMILPSIAYRTQLFQGYGVIEEPFFVEHTKNPSDDVRKATERIIAHLEVAIRRHPEQWSVFSEIWPADVDLQRQEEQVEDSVTIPPMGTTTSSVEAAGDP
jgi:lauroyl/myristoyl acyltransferase